MNKGKEHQTKKPGPQIMNLYQEQITLMQPHPLNMSFFDILMTLEISQAGFKQRTIIKSTPSAFLSDSL